MSSERAQASVETVVLVPALVLLVVAVWQVVVLTSYMLSVQDAARAGARAALAGEPVRPVVLRSLPGSLRPTAAISRTAGRITVRARVPTVVPGFSPVLEAGSPLVRG